MRPITAARRLLGSGTDWRARRRRSTVVASVLVAHRRSFASGSAYHGGGKPSAGGLDPAIADYLSQHVTSAAATTDYSTEKQKNQLFLKMVQSLEAVYGKNQLKLSHLQSFGGAGLNALAASILQEEEKQKSSASDEFVTVRFMIPHHQTQFDLKWYYVSEPTMLNLAQSTEGAELLSEYIEGTCGGNASCCTCHVYIENRSSSDTAALLTLSDVTEAELDMLDLAYQPTDASRLACQVRLLQVPPGTDTQEPMLTVTIPSGVNNVWN